MDNSLRLVPGASNRCRRFGPVGFFRRDFIDSCLRRGHLRQSKGLRARVISNVNEGETDDQSDVELQATIEKSKKVLAKQKKLLQQVIFLSFFLSCYFFFFLFSSCLLLVACLTRNCAKGGEFCC